MTRKLPPITLGLAVLAACALFMTYQTYGNLEFAIALRGKKNASLYFSRDCLQFFND